VFGRAALHRFRKKHETHPAFKKWWDSIRSTAEIQFFEDERNWILKEDSARVGQKIFFRGFDNSGRATERPPDPPRLASDFYYYEDPTTPATDTVRKHLVSLEALLGSAETQLFI